MVLSELSWKKWQFNIRLHPSHLTSEMMDCPAHLCKIKGSQKSREGLLISWYGTITSASSAN